MPLVRRGIGGPRRGRPGLMGTVARTAVVAGTATAVSNKVSQHGAEKQQQAAEAQAYQEQQAQAAQAAAAPPAAAPAAASEDVYAQLRELGALKDQGILTEEEFAAQKAKLLG